MPHHDHQDQEPGQFQPRQEDRREGLTRRTALRRLGAAGLSLAALGTGLDELLTASPAAGSVRSNATGSAGTSAAPNLGRLGDIEHVIILMQENRSFDHYFGTLSGVRGFADSRNRQAFTQVGGGGQTLAPFHLAGQCLLDITHSWKPQHDAWDGGRNDGFLRIHEQVDGFSGTQPIGTETMGYYTRADLPFYYSLADAFTICDAYHCSVLGPTDPNRLMSLSATVDPGGHRGGPLVQTLSPAARIAYTGRFRWTTMPEQLRARGVSWKVYNSPVGGIFDNVLPYFAKYSPGSKLARLALEPSYPNDFLADLARGELPQVSWILTGIADTEHPAYSSPQQGETAVATLLTALFAHPRIWERCALFITWDENGGFFDHVPPPTPPPGTQGEYLTASLTAINAAGAEAVPGPIGLGFRVGMLVVSPFSQGGFVCSDTFDHTSTLRFLETRFGAEVPNLSAWRRAHTGDLTSAFNLAAPARRTPPALAPPAPATCQTFAVPPVSPGALPSQEPGRRRRPSGLVRPRKVVKRRGTRRG
jgi:phospholipase C